MLRGGQLNRIARGGAGRHRQPTRPIGHCCLPSTGRIHSNRRWVRRRSTAGWDRDSVMGYRENAIGRRSRGLSNGHDGRLKAGVSRRHRDRRGVLCAPSVCNSRP